MATSDKIENARTRVGSRPRLNMFNAVKDVPMSSKSATDYEPNTSGACSDNSNTEYAIIDEDPNTTYEDIDSARDEPDMSCTHVDNSNITTTADDLNVTYEEIDTLHHEPNYGDLANRNNEPDITYEEVDAVYDEVDAPTGAGLQVNAMGIYNATSLSHPSANTQRPALSRPAESDQEYAEATYASTYASNVNWWTRNRIWTAAKVAFAVIIVAAVALAATYKSKSAANVLRNSVFTVNESSTDYHVTFAENFLINIHNATNYMFRVTQSLVTFEVKICSNGTEIMYNGRLCVGIQIFTSHQESIRLVAIFSLKTLYGGWSYLFDTVSTLSVNDTQIYSMKSNDTNLTKEFHDGDMLTIGIQGSYLIRIQHTIVTLPAKFNLETHTSVNMSYTWTVCNLTLLNSNETDRYVASEALFANIDVAEFYLIMRLCDDENYVAIISELKNAPTSINMPFHVERTLELIDSNSMEHAVIVSIDMPYEYEHRQSTEYTAHQIDYTDLVLSMRQQCAIFKYNVAYELL